jgi:signal transduction histidine kinase
MNRLRANRDVLIAAAFVTWAMVEIAAGTVLGPAWQTVPTALVTTVALAGRRRWPRASALICAAGVAVRAAIGLNMQGMALLTAVVFASYTVGRHVALRRAAVVIGLMVAIVWSVLWRVRDGGLYDWVFALMWIGGPGVAGASLRFQVERAAALAARATRAELDRDLHVQTALRRERVRIARELHDTVTHAVSVMVLHAGAVRSRLVDGTDAEQQALAETEATGRRAIAELRQLLELLRADDAAADPDDGAASRTEVAPSANLAALPQLVKQSRTLGLAVDLRVIGSVEGLDPMLESSAYRIVQEALTNIRRHGQTTHALVCVDVAPDSLRTQVIDHGVGADLAASNGGLGLIGMRERIAVFGGRMTITSRPGQGFTLDASLPVGVR